MQTRREVLLHFDPPCMAHWRVSLVVNLVPLCYSLVNINLALGDIYLKERCEVLVSIINALIEVLRY